MTYPLLEKAPQHDSPEFLQYLRDNNVVVLDSPLWLVIQNCKYHKKERAWYTAFLKPAPKNGVPDVSDLISVFGDLEWKKKSADTQTIKRFHIHLYESNQS